MPHSLAGATMSDTSPTADELEQQIEADALSGVSSFSDGSHNVSMASAKERMDLVDRKRRNSVVANNPARGMKFSRMIPPGCG